MSAESAKTHENASSVKSERTSVVATIDEDDNTWEEGLNSEIRRMTHDADAILESIRQVATAPASPNNESFQTPGRYVADDEDDDMDDEIQRLGSLSEEMRKTFDAELRNVESSFRSEGLSPVGESSAGSTEGPSSPTSQPPDLVKSGIDESLLVTTTIIWSIIIFIVVYAKNHLLNEEGKITLPFLSG